MYSSAVVFFLTIRVLIKANRERMSQGYLVKLVSGDTGVET